MSEDTTLDVLQSIGCRGVPSKENLSTRDEIIRSLVIGGIYPMLAIMDQLSSGLMLFGVLEQIKTHREDMATMLTIEGAKHFHLTADKILDNIVVDGSPEGSNKKSEEIDIHKFDDDDNL